MYFLLIALKNFRSVVVIIIIIIIIKTYNYNNLILTSLGKSYLGIVIVQALYIIRSLWTKAQPTVGSPPILVLSYKNHAIDEFLLDLVNAMKNEYRYNLIRVGAGCKEPGIHYKSFSKQIRI
jgi:hypothetical protein